MKRNLGSKRLAAWCVGALCLGSLCAAGDVNPPAGPVGPTMKTLDEVEPRTPIHESDLPLVISASGSYYLAESISTAGGGITIAADDVTLDLMGFALRGGTGSGIHVQGPVHGVVIRDGTIEAWDVAGVEGNANGLTLSELTLLNNTAGGVVFGADCRVRGCKAIGNSGAGFAGGSGIIEDCLASQNQDAGFLLGEDVILRRCISNYNTFQGFVGGNNVQLIDCQAVGNLDMGIDTMSGVISGCLVSNGPYGIHTYEGTVRDCTVREIWSPPNPFPGIGIDVGEDGAVLNCTLDTCGVGILANAFTRIEGNHLHGCEAGILAMGEACVIKHNTVIECGGGIGTADIASHCVVADNTVLRSLTSNYSITPVTSPGDEHRIEVPLCEIPQIIDFPCTVRLTGDLTSDTTGLIVASENVTIDLGGHALIGSETSTVGIDLQSHEVTIRNGTIRDWGSSAIGTSAGAFGVNCVYEDLVVVGNARGTPIAAVEASLGTVIRDCLVQDNGGDGISCPASDTRVERCTVRRNAGRGVEVGLFCEIRDCTVSENQSHGIEANGSCWVVGCNVEQNLGDGITVFQECHVMGNRAFANDGVGIRANNYCLIADNVANGQGGAAIKTDGNFNVVTGNRVIGSWYDLSPGTDAGPIEQAATATSPTANLLY